MSGRSDRKKQQRSSVKADGNQSLPKVAPFQIVANSQAKSPFVSGLPTCSSTLTAHFGQAPIISGLRDGRMSRTSAINFRRRSMTQLRVSGIEPGQRRLNGPQTTARDYRNLSTPMRIMTRDDDVPVCRTFKAVPTGEMNTILSSSRLMLPVLPQLFNDRRQSHHRAQNS
jgi:hypothetical protein